MALPKETLTIGIEEELFIVDENTLDLVTKVPEDIFKRFNQRYPDQLTGEFLPAQVEIISKPCPSIFEISNQMSELRRYLIELCHEYGLNPVAISTHPQGAWQNQIPRHNKRYDRIAERLRMVVNRLLVCGMHIHVGIDDPQKRLQVNNQLIWFLPHILLLTTSSPFWGGHDSGLNSYRLCVLHTLPRTGVQPLFSDYDEYQAYLDTMVKSNEVLDSSEIWWDSRLSCRFPTVEMRVPDTCTRFRDLIAVASFTKSLIHYLMRCPQPLSTVHRLISLENSWLARRYSRDKAELISTDGDKRPYIDIMMELIDLISEDAEALGCYRELLDVKHILREGTSADRQRACFLNSQANGMLPDIALKRVVEQAIEETAMDVL